jgi:death-on-curing protein
MERTYLTVRDVEEIYAEVFKATGGADIRDRGGLESAVFRPQTGHYADLFEEAAALMESLTMNHPFVNGNEGTALTAVEVFLDYNGHMLNIEGRAAYDLFMDHIRKGTVWFPTVVERLRRHVHPRTDPKR